jgi:hypothetical protein
MAGQETARSFFQEGEGGLNLGIAQAALFGLGATYGYVQLARCSEMSREKGLDTTRGKVVNGEWRPA